MSSILRSCLCLVVLLSASCSPENDKPNIVIIFIDDMGYGDLGKYGAQGFNTPNLDKMASQGMMFTQFYSIQAVCSASRAGLLTGCYPNRIGITGALNHTANHGLNESETTIAELLKDQGYSTALFGKWHLGHHEKFLPLQHGFDEFVGLPYSNDMWPVDYAGKPHEGRKANYPKLPLIEGNETIEYVENLGDQDNLTTLYTEKAVDFIHKNSENPFFLYVPHSMVHVPLGVSDKFRGKSEQGFFGDVMMEVDWSVGEIFKALEDKGIADNTMVFFTSDNGPWLNYGNHAGNTGGFREGKGTSWEGGQRVPAIAVWPGKIPAGSVSSQLSATIDLLPTIASITGARLPETTIDGVDISEVLEGNKNAEPRDHLYYYYNRNDLEAVRKGSWKLVFPHKYRSYENVIPKNDGWPGPYGRGSTDLALFDLRRDPGERYDVKADYPEVVEELMELGEKARQDLGDNLTAREGANVRMAGWLGDIPVKRKLSSDHLASNSSVSYLSEYSERYPAAGVSALTDGLLGNSFDFNKNWQGWHSQDIDIKVDLGEVKAITSVTSSFLENQGAWIFLPKSLEIFVSTDGKSFNPIISQDVELKPTSGSYVRDYSLNWTGNARYIQLKARSIGNCPDWHVGAGEKSWTFLDEIVIR